MLMKHQPVLVLQHFIIIYSPGLSQFCNAYEHWPVLVLQHFIIHCSSGLSQFCNAYEHQPGLVLQHFIILCSLGLSQFCNVYKTSACTGSAMFIKHWPRLVLQHFIFFWLLRPVPFLWCYQTSACPRFAALDMFQACTSSAAFIDYQHVPLLQYWCSSGLYQSCIFTKHRPAQFCVCWPVLASPAFTGKCTNPMLQGSVTELCGTWW